MQKIGVRKITIVREEGSPDLCDIPHEFSSFGDANAFLRESARSAPEKGGYDKHSVVIIWDDGYTYRGRWDVKFDGSNTSIGLQIERDLAYVIDHPERFSERDRQDAAYILENYMLYR